MIRTITRSCIFFSLCEHHALPFHGHAYVGYIAHEHIIGISKLTRLVRLFAKRFAVQERIGQQIADTLEAMLAPHGVACIDYLDHPFKNRPFETEKEILSLLANTGRSV